jgi:hypothetical protein
MRTWACILLAAALLLSIFGFVECFPGIQERAWSSEVQRLSVDGQSSEILSHFQAHVRAARADRIEVATLFFVIAGLLYYFAWVASARLETRLLHVQCIGGILMSVALLLAFYAFAECFPSTYERAWKIELQSLSAQKQVGDAALWRESKKHELALNIQSARESRFWLAVTCVVIATFLVSIGWLAISKAELPNIAPVRDELIFTNGPLILPAKPRLKHLHRFSMALFRRVERIKSARIDVRPKLETVFERPSETRRL